MTYPPAPWPRVAAGLTAAFILAGIGLGIVSPSAYRQLLAEDAWGEWATFTAFLIASLLAAHLAVRGRAESSPSHVRALERLGDGGVAAFCAFVAGEEISWGQRVAGFVPPEIFLERNYQQEANLHNLLKDIFDSRWQVVVIALGYGALAPIVASRSRFVAALAPARILAPGFIAVALLEVAYPFDLAGELAELALGLSFVVDVSLRRAGPDRIADGARRGVSLAAGALVAAALLGPAVELATRGDQPERVALAAAELQLLATDLRTGGAVRPKLLAKQRVHKRIFTATRERYLHFGDAGGFLEGRATPAEDAEGGRRDRRGYFLDPWGQPYWILAQPSEGERGRALLYSFGPNRKRDADPGSGSMADAAVEPTLGGDDLGVVVDLGR